jgi:nucleoside-diphosphate-sugar epimerase
MKALILGGSGFVGRRLAEIVATGDVDITVLNRGVTPVSAPPGVKRITADRTDLAAMRAALRGRDWDAVFDVSGVIQVAGGSAMADLADLLDGRIDRYVFVSSQSVYQMTGVFPWFEDSPTVRPDTATYAGFKAAAEQTLLARHADTGFPAAIARPAAIYGPYNNIYDMEPAMFRRLLDRRPILLPYAGLVVVSYGHVDDLCRALIVMATRPAAVGEIFNVTTSAVTSSAYIDTLATVAEADPDVVPVPDDVAEQAEGPLFSRLFTPRHHGMLDAAKLTTLLGFAPSYDLRGGHTQTFEWFTRSGMPAMEAAADPLWGRTFDFAYEAKMAGALRGH